MLRRALVVTFLLVGGTALVGCDNKPKRYHAWGKITYLGQPIPAGSIHFEPDIANGGKGPQGFAIIKNGEYDTRKDDGLGHTGGKYIARVYATDGVPQPERPNGIPLFPERNVKLASELPTQDGELDIDVPRQ